MGDLSARSGVHTPATKPRPLGKVKTESLHFHSEGTRQSTLLPGYPDLQDLYEAEDIYGDYGLRVSLKSMRELRESLRHAALLNIVAAANQDESQMEGGEADNHRPQQQPPGTASTQHLYSSLHYHHHQQPRGTSPLVLQVTSSRSSPHSGDGATGGRSAGSSNFHSSNGTSHGGATSPHTLVANLLSPRMRTISIPRPRAHELPGPFIHRSVTQAKENLSRVGEMVRARAEGEEPVSKIGVVVTAAGDTGSSWHDGAWRGGVVTSGAALVSPLIGHSLDPKHNQQQDKQGEPTSAKQSRDTSAQKNSNPPSASMTSGRSTTDLPLSASTASRKSGRSRDDPHQQMLNVRRHLTPSKKRELVKRLTEIAKCDAVDMSDPGAADDEADLRFVSPMIILSQQRYENHHPDVSPPVATPSNKPSSALANGDTNDTKPSANDAKPPATAAATTNSTAKGVSNTGLTGLHRAKSLTSLSGYNGHGFHPPGSRNKKNTTGAASVVSLGHAQSERGPWPSAMDHAQSVPDLTQNGDGLITEQDGEAAENDDLNAESLFTDGIIGKMIRRGGNGSGRTPLESRPLLPATPNIRTRRGTRPTGRRSSLGLRDRAPTDISTLSLSPQTASTTQKSSQSESADSSSAPPPELNFQYAQVLPTLTITGLSARDKPPPGSSLVTSRAARELRPSSQLNVSNSQKLFQQLDDQCEKLQRQLNISLNVPRRGSHWQHGSTPTTLPISRSDVTAHLQCVALTEGSVQSSSRTLLKDSNGRRSQNLTAQGNPSALSDVDEYSVVEGGNAEQSKRVKNPWRDDDGQDSDEKENGETTRQTRQPSRNPQNNENSTKRPGLSSRHSLSSLDGPSLRMNLDDTPDTDPTMQSGQKEPRFQGFSSRVGENEGRSQFHYVNTNRTDEEEAREMKYRVLKALDQDVYYDFQHRKYRNSASTPVTTKFNNEEDRPRVHFYKVKVKCDS